MARKKPRTHAAPSRRSHRLEAQATVTREKEQQVAETTVPTTTPPPPSKPKKFRRPRQRKSCKLLSLPGELRNRIYEFAVLEPHPVLIFPDGPGQPSLLRVCRQVRREAGTIYYRANKFTMCVESWDGAAFVPFAYSSRKLKGYEPIGNVSFIFDGNYDWDNLVAWIKAEHFDNAMTPEIEEKHMKNSHVAAGAFKLANEWGIWSWPRKEEVLKVLYGTLRGTNSPWVKHEDRILY